MIVKIDLQEIVTAKRVLEVQLASYQIEADIIGFYEQPPLQDATDSLQKCDETFYRYFYKGVLAGIIAFKYIDQIMDIHRVAVHPHYFRLGIARQFHTNDHEILPVSITNHHQSGAPAEDRDLSRHEHKQHFHLLSKEGGF